MSEHFVHEPDLHAHPKKPALKMNSKYSKKKVTLTWDEHAIEEHDQLRGTRMKIDEPDTPFAYDHQSDSEASAGSHRERTDKRLNPFALENKLGAVAAARELCPSSPSISSHGNSSGQDSDAEQERRRRMKAKEFEMHRKSHYNEMEALRRWKMSHQDDDDDDDDDDE